MTPKEPDIVSVIETGIDLRMLREDGDLCDLTIQIEDVCFPCHRIILIATSPYFLDLHKEGHLDHVNLPPNIHPFMFSIFLDFMYFEPLSLPILSKKLNQFTQFVDAPFHKVFDDLTAAASFFGLTQLAWAFSRWRERLLVEREMLDQKDVKVDETSLVPLVELSRIENISPVEEKTDLDTIDDVIADDSNVHPKVKRKIKPLPKRRPLKSQLCRTIKRQKPKLKKTAIVQRNLDENSLPSQKRKIFIPDLKESSSNAQEIEGTAYGHKEERTKPHDSRYTTMSDEEVKLLFTNRKDYQTVVRNRILGNIEKVQGDGSSWHYATDHPTNFLGYVVPFGNSQAKIWDKDGKKIRGEIRNTNSANVLELKLEDQSLQTLTLLRKPNLRCPLPLCEDSFNMASRHRLASHFLNDHGYLWIEMGLVCDLCEFVTTFARGLRDHLLRYHNVFDSITERTIFPCRKCGRTWRFKDPREKHERVCTGKAPPRIKTEKKAKEADTEKIVCSICGQTFTFNSQLENHMSHMHGAPSRYQCNQEGCDYKTNNKNTFFDHMFTNHKINIGGKPVLSCSYCEYATLRKSTFDRHVECHTFREDSEKCLVPGCGKAFKTQKHLRHHMKEIHEDLALSCEYCGGVYRSKFKLKCHIRIMHTERVRRFKCAYCSHATVQRTNCRTHVKSAHRELPVVVLDLEKIGIKPAPEPTCLIRGSRL